MNELEMVNGGDDTDVAANSAMFGGIGALGGVGLGLLLSGPVGWCALGGAAVCGGVAAVVTMALDED